MTKENRKLRDALRTIEAMATTALEHQPDDDALAMKRLSRDRYTPGYFLHRFPMRRGTFAASDAEEAPTPASCGKPTQMELFAS